MLMEEACLQVISQVVMTLFHNTNNAILQVLRHQLYKLWEYQIKRWENIRDPN